MRVWFVLSETWEDGGGELEPPEDTCLCCVAVAETRSKAKYLAIQSDRTLRRYGVADWPLCSVRQIGDEEGPARVLGSAEAESWWPKCPHIYNPLRTR
jgi:hypothetical protein